jgi:hypothetical protein
MSFPAADSLIDGVELGAEELEAGAGAADVAMGAGLQPAAAIERPTIIPAAMMMRCMVVPFSGWLPYLPLPPLPVFRMHLTPKSWGLEVLRHWVHPNRCRVPK